MSLTRRERFDHLRLQRLAAGEGEQLAGQLGGALGAVKMAFFSRGSARASLGHRRAEQLEVAADHLQQVVEVVGDAAGELADRLHPLGFAQPLLGADPVGDVAHRADQPVAGAVAGLHRGQDRFPDAGRRPGSGNSSRVVTGLPPARTRR